MKKILLLVMALLASQANAGIISADFVTRADNRYVADLPEAPDYPYARQLSALGQSVGAGVELGANAIEDSPVAWDEGVLNGLVHLDFDPVTMRLTLSSQGDGDFDIFTARLSNILFDGMERISGLSLVSNSLAENPLSEDHSVIMPTWSITDNGLEIKYSADLDAGEFFYLMAGGEAVFQLLTDAAAPGGDVPEPASLGLLGLGLAGLVGARRRAVRR